MTNEVGGDLDPNFGDDADMWTDRAFEVVRAQATERPLITLGVATGVGFVLGGGLPRFGMLLGLGVTGLVLGYGLPRWIRSRAQDESDDATLDHDESSGIPTLEGSAAGPARKHRRSKRKNASAGPG